jgi:short-subunit dehydrogenase
MSVGSSPTSSAFQAPEAVVQVPMRSDSSTSSSATEGRALVTGASRGLGAEYAEQLAAGGHDLVVTARTKSRLEELARRLREKYGVEVDVLVADLGQEEGLRAVEERVASDPKLTVLVNNAGFGTWGRFVDLDFERELEMIRVNVLATVRLTRAALPGMIERGRGGIINVSSVSAFLPQVYSATYNATKAYIRNFSECVHEELRGTGVNVQVVCPGFMRTKILTQMGVDPKRIPWFLWMYPRRCVRFSLAALRRGKPVCVPNFGYRILVAAVRILPRGFVRWCVRSLVGRFDRWGSPKV